MNWDFDIKAPIYFCNEKIDLQLPSKIQQIKTGQGSFVQNLKSSLSQIKENNVFLILEDFWVLSPLRKKMFYLFFNIFKSEDLDALQVGPYAPYYKLKKTSHKNFYAFDAESSWIFNFQARFWKKDVLSKCLVEPQISESLINSAISVEKESDDYARLNFKLKVWYFCHFWYPTFGGALNKGELTDFGKQLYLFSKLGREAKTILQKMSN